MQSPKFYILILQTLSPVSPDSANWCLNQTLKCWSMHLSSLGSIIAVLFSLAYPQNFSTSSNSFKTQLPLLPLSFNNIGLSTETSFLTDPYETLLLLLLPPPPRYTPSLRSSSAGSLSIPTSRHSTMGARALSCSAPKFWNSLHPYMYDRQIHTITTFKSQKNPISLNWHTHCDPNCTGKPCP